MTGLMSNNQEDYMRDYKDVLKKCSDAGIVLWVDNGKLKYKANTNVLSGEILEGLKEFKSQIIEYYEKADKNLTIAHDSKNRYEVFPLTEVQSAYLLGRGDYFDYGNTACHIYQEFSYDRLDVEKVERVWNSLIKKHDALRTVIYKAGYQKVLEKAPRFTISEIQVAEGNQEELTKLRAEMGKRIFPLERWPMFEIAVSQQGNKSVLHFSMDFLIADWSSIWQLLEEFESLYFENEDSKAPEITFRDYVLFEERKKEYQQYETDRLFWKAKTERFFLAPSLPEKGENREQRLEVEFERYSLNLAPVKWEKFKYNCSKFNVTPTAGVLTVYSEILKRWSSNKEICLNLTVLNREAPNEEVNRIIGDFTKIVLLKVDNEEIDFYKRARKVNAELFENLEHCGYSGVDVIRDIAKEKGREYASMPYVFTSAIGLIRKSIKGKYEGNGISQTPQVFIDCQAMDGDFGLQVNWDVRKGVFHDGMIKDMFAVFRQTLEHLSDNIVLWNQTKIIDLPDAQKERRNKANSREAVFEDKLLYEDFLKISKAHPEYTAVYDSLGTMSYGELLDLSLNIAKKLKEESVEAGEKIIISAPKNRYQVASVLATLFIGGVYVPVDINSPQKRAESIIAQCDSKVILKTTTVNVQGNEKCLNIDVDCLTNDDKINFKCTTVQTKEPAYVIFTSGTTGTPKGVVVSHRAAWNTICDINETYHVNHEDRIFAISKLNFDLSVYDLFGMLSVGAAIVYVDDSNYMNPQEWHDKIVQHNVTIWNSVPALRSLYLTYLKENAKMYKESIRLSLLSGDWIPKKMPEDILNYNKEERIICLGGATEAAIWSIAHEYKGLETWWNSIPYGIPLKNQKFFVVDENGEDCPDWCVGELWIAGTGLADKYLGESELTNKKFFYSNVHNCRVYRTGDMGRYIPTGEIEFLGRTDNQVKVRGYRIELGEIENALEMQEEIKQAIVRIDNDKKEFPIRAIVEIATIGEGERQRVIDQKKDILKNIETVNAEFEAKLSKTNYKNDFAQRDKFAFASILCGLEKVGCFEKYRTYKDMIEHSPIEKKYQWLLSRWLIVLEENEYIKKYNDEYFITQRYSEEENDIIAKNIFENWVDEYGDINLMKYIQDNGKQISEILKGKVDPVGILYPEGLNKYTKALYVTSSVAKVINHYYCSFISEYMKRNAGRKIRILEIGAGTAATALPIIDTLKDAEYEYYFTDITKYFLPRARKLFENNNRVIIRQFNVDEDYTKQGLQPNYFDIIIGAYVLENVKDIRKSISLIKDLVAPQGYLLFSEPIRNEPWILASQALMMTEPEDELRNNTFFVTPDCWKEVLDECDKSSHTSIYPDMHSSLCNLGAVLFIKQFKTDKKLIDRERIRKNIHSYIPDYMTPKEILYFEKFFLSENGKIESKKMFSYFPQNSKRATESYYNCQITGDTAKKILEVWRETLGSKTLGMDDNLYDYGADSLLMAQAVTKMREKLKLEIPFEELLRHVIKEPTVCGCEDYISNYRKNKEKQTDIKNDSMFFVKRYDNHDSDSVRVLVHGALGSIENYAALGGELSKWKSRNVIAFGIADYAKYKEITSENLVLELAEQYSQYLINSGWKNIQLIGYSFSGSIIIEMARLLVEQGVKVDNVTIIESGTIPIYIKSDLLLELLFLDSMGVSEKVLGIEQRELLKEIFNFVKLENLTEVDDKIFSSILCSDKDRKRVSYLLDMGMKKRLDMYQKESKNDNNFQNLYPIYKKSFEALQITPNIYFGDITYCSVEEREGAYENFNALLEKWDDILLGNIKQKIIAGNHYTCMNLENAASLAKIITSETRDDNLDGVKSEKEKKHFIVTEDYLEKNHFYIEYAIYKRKESILCAMLRFLVNRGIFVNENQVYTFEEIKEKINALPENEEILRRWLKALNSYGFIKEESNGFLVLVKITEQFFETIWVQMEKMWNGKLCSKLANEYLLKNIKALPELFSGKINPTHILFPEGKFDYAEALYKDTFIFRYLNAKVAQKLEEYLNIAEDLEILELGAGTGATTDNILPLIKERKNVIYYFSDISYVFLREAQHKYAEFKNIMYMTLNINNLDFEKKVDIIIANGVLNNAKNIKYTLNKMLEITSKKGKIFIIEQVEESLEMLVSQVFMMKESSALEEEGGKTFRSTEEWLQLLEDDRVEKIEVFPKKYNIDQRLFILYRK